MSEKNSWNQDFPETPESFRMTLKHQVEKEMADENVLDYQAAGKKMKKHSNMAKRKWHPIKVAAAALILIGLISGGVYAVAGGGISELVGRTVDETEAESYLTTDTDVLHQTVIPGWPQTMVDIGGEDNAAEVKGYSEPLLNIIQVYYDGLSLAFYARPTNVGKRCELNSDRLVIGDAVYMIQFTKLPNEYVKEHPEMGLRKGDYKGTVQLGGREIPNNFTASLIVNAGSWGTQTVSFDVQMDENAVIKSVQSVTTDRGVNVTVDALKIAASGTYIHVTWEFDETQKELYEQMTKGASGDEVQFLALDDDHGNHYTTENNADTRQTIVFTKEGDDWSGAYQRNSYEADGKYYYEMNAIIEGMNQDVSWLAVTPYIRTGAEEGEEHTYKTLDFAAFRVEYN